MKLVIYPPIKPERVEQIRQVAPTLEIIMAENEANAVVAIRDADALFGYLTKPMLAAAEKLVWVQAPTASMEKFLYPELVESPVKVSNMRGIFGDVIADHVFAYILCFAKNFHIYLRQQMQSHWQALGREANELPGYGGPMEVHPSDCAAITLGDATLGVVGLGGIGSEVANRGKAFGMRVLAMDPKISEAPEGITLFSFEQLDEMLAQSDFVVIAAPHTPETFKLFNRTRMQKMKKTAFLINVGRGVIVDLGDLTAALQAGEIAGAGLDVFEIEPLPKEHPLWQMANVIITPHTAAASPRVPERYQKFLLENLRRCAAGEPVLNVVDKTKWC